MDIALVELAADHPGFNDREYRKRRNEIAQFATLHEEGQPIPRIDYTKAEVDTWTTVFRALTALYPTHACREYCGVFTELGYREDRIPQLTEVSAFLERATGFALRPVAGLVSDREFLGALAARRFLCTQFIRHGSQPHYTPEPDLVHELMGHAPMLAIPEYAALSARLGAAAKRASDDQIRELATLYWYTVEYGVVREEGRLRAYGAGLLSSFGELERAIAGRAETRPLVPELAKDIPHPITQYQPLLWEVATLRDAFEKLDAYVGSQAVASRVLGS